MKHTKETKTKMRAKKLGKDNPNYNNPTSETTKAKIRKKNSGEGNHMFGKEHSNETKAQITKSLTGKTQSAETIAKRKASLEKYYALKAASESLLH